MNLRHVQLAREHRSRSRAGVEGLLPCARPPECCERGALGASGVRRVVTSLALVSALLQTSTALACPDCAVGQVARQLVWTDSFSFHLAVTLTPFAIVAVVCVWADRIGRPASGSQ